MIELQKYCHEFDGPPVEIVGEGKLYAGKFREDWYRYVQGTIYAILQCKKDSINSNFVSECMLPILSAITRYPYISVISEM